VVKTLAGELGPAGIRVNGLLSVRIATDRVREPDALRGDPDEVRARLSETRGVRGARHRLCRTSHGHRLPLSTCHVRSGPWMTWRVTAPDSTVAPLPLRLTCRQPSAGIPVRPPCRANQAAAATGVG